MSVRERTITFTGTDPAPPSQAGPPQPGVVMVFHGGATVPVAHPVDRPTSFGRGEDADVVIDDPGVSRRHMIVEPAGGGVTVRDAGSRNGTFLDGTALDATPRFAGHGSVIRLGKTLLVVEADVRPYRGAGAVETTGLVGGPGLADVRRRVEVLRTSAVPVLVEGETGTGKEVVARVLHEARGRTGTFVEINCAALPGELVESELFGHVKGSFSGSDRARVGLFRTADGGTLLLDEIGELPMALQAKLLRVLETGEVRPVGDDKPVAVDVRVVAATNRSLDRMVDEGAFRLDLFHRIAATRITLPPLRDRIEDVPLLCRHFLGNEGPRISTAAMEVLLLHRYPGNVRELRNVLSAAAASATEGTIHVAEVRAALPKAVGRDDDGRSRIVAALAEAGGNVTRAAKDLGVARSGLYETLRRLHIDPSKYRRSDEDADG